MGKRAQMAAPAWSRLLCGLSRAVTSIDLTQQLVRDELLLAFLRPSERNALTLDSYARSRIYLQGGQIFEKGLFPWEIALLDDPRTPRSGRVLLGGAGGGRELQALLERGYHVDAFEPVRELFESARAVARGHNAVVVNAAYEDLVARAHGKPGRLDGYQGPADLCILGWGSLSHLTEPAAVLELFRALRVLSPQAPVVTSFFLKSEINERKLRRALRRMLELAGGSPVPPGLKFQSSHGFYYEFSQSELAELCKEAGYEMVHFAAAPYPHALLLPNAA